LDEYKHVLSINTKRAKVSPRPLYLVLSWYQDNSPSALAGCSI
jgi:hypothetical protein